MSFDYQELENNVLVWAETKGILAGSTPLAQFTKTAEEVNELLVAIVNDDKPEVIDAIGDIIVTLIIQAELQGVDAVFCLEQAYNVINKRSGKMVDGVFVKDD